MLSLGLPSQVEQCVLGTTQQTLSQTFNSSNRRVIISLFRPKATSDQLIGVGRTSHIDWNHVDPWTGAYRFEFTTLAMSELPYPTSKIHYDTLAVLKRERGRQIICSSIRQATLHLPCC